MRAPLRDLALETTSGSGAEYGQPEPFRRCPRNYPGLSPTLQRNMIRSVLRITGLLCSAAPRDARTATHCRASVTDWF
jgi:hypothetical protein